MKTFYLFLIKDEFYKLYFNKEKDIFNIIKEISNISDSDLDYAINIYDQFFIYIDKNYLDRKIFIDMHSKIEYQKYSDTHKYINSITNEKTSMVIKNTYIKINTNKDLPFFYSLLLKYNYDFFIIDFINNKYFYLNRPKILV